MCLRVQKQLCVLKSQAAGLGRNTFSPEVLGKMPLTKKAHEKSLTSIEQNLMAGPNCQAGRGKDGAAQSLGKEWLL
jgi:hypothetical protein